MLAPLALLGLVTIQVIQDERPDVSATSGFEDPARGDTAWTPEGAAHVQEKVVEHCEVALGKGECRAALSAETASARVQFEKNRVVVSLLSEPTIPRRSLEFSPADAPEQRQVAAGLLVAAMSAAARGEREAQARRDQEQAAQREAEALRKSEARLDKERPRPRPPTEESRPPAARFLFDLGATLTPPIDGSNLTLGGLLRTTWQASSLAGLFVEFRFAQSVGDPPRVRFGDAGLGASVMLTRAHSPVSAWLNAGVVLNLVEVSQVRDLEQSQIALRGGGRLGFGFAPRLLPLAPWLAVDLAGFAPTVEVRAGDALVERLPAFIFTASLGARWDTSR